MNESDSISHQNNELLQRIAQILEGSKDAPGLVARVAEHDVILNGRSGTLGLLQKVAVMWRAHVWVIASLSAIIGWVAKTLLTKI